MPRMADAPLIKVTLNLYASDVKWFQARFGQGYTAVIRNVLHKHARRNEDTVQEWIEDEHE